MVFYAGATDTATGECEYHRCTDGGEEDFLWLRASASMPVVSRPVPIGGKTYLDGGISDAVPYAYMKAQGYDRQVIVLTQPKGYRKAKIPAAAKLLLHVLLRGLPAIRDAMDRRAEMYNREMDELDRMEADGTALVIRPPEPLRIGHTEKNPEELERVYRTGRREAERRLEEIRAWIVKIMEEI